MYILVSSKIPITFYHSPQGFLIIINTKRKETMIKCPCRQFNYLLEDIVI